MVGTETEELEEGQRVVLALGSEDFIIASPDGSEEVRVRLQGDWHVRCQTVAESAATRPVSVQCIWH